MGMAGSHFIAACSNAVPVLTLTTLALALAGCGDSAPDPEAVAADVAEIEAIHDTPPVQPVSPERISYTDIEKNNLFGAGCGFAPDGGMAIMFLAQESHGFIKLDDKIVTLAPDKGSAPLPLGAFAQYVGREFSVALELDQTKGEQDGIETTKFPGKMTIRDMKERVVYDADGTIGCGS